MTFQCREKNERGKVVEKSYWASMCTAPQYEGVTDFLGYTGVTDYLEDDYHSPISGQGPAGATSSELPGETPQPRRIRPEDRERLWLESIRSAPRAAQEWARTNPNVVRPQTPQTWPQSPLEGSPDRVFHLAGAQECLDEDGVSHTEVSAEEADRLQRLAQRLGELETTTEEVAFALRVEQEIPNYKDLYGQWVAADYKNRESVTLKSFAMERLCEMDVNKFEFEYDLKVHVYALGRLAERTPQQSRTLSKSLWQSSTCFSTPPAGGDSSHESSSAGWAECFLSWTTNNDDT